MQIPQQTIRNGLSDFEGSNLLSIFALNSYIWDFIHYQKPGPLGLRLVGVRSYASESQVRDNGLCLDNNTKCGVN
jgi:hypothetical protein